MKEITKRHIKDLRAILDADLPWYEYQYCRYFNDSYMDLRGNYETMQRTLFNTGFVIQEREDLQDPANFNVIKSVIDAIVSKIYNQKVLPHFDPVNGYWETNRIANEIEQYFQLLYDNENINKKMSAVFKMSCIFGRGHIFVDEFNEIITPLCPHCVAFLNSETRYGKQKPQRCLIRYNNMPVENLTAYGIKKPSDVISVNFSWYIDVEEQTQVFFIDNEKVKELPYTHSCLPILTNYYNEPLFGMNTVSIVKELDGIQNQIDLLSSKLSAASELTPANQVFVLEGSSLQPKDISNLTGMRYALKMPPGTSTPPVVSITPPPYDTEWKNWLGFLIEKAYAQIGISELSATGKKQAGLNSGISMQTFEDIESDRFETQLTHYINSFVELAKLLIEILDDDKDILPQSINNSSLKWKDVKKQSNLLKIQYTAISKQSKDPVENIKTIMNMAQTGGIPVYKLARSMNNPDLIEATNSAAANYDAIQQVIARAIEKEEYDIPEFVNHDELGKEITTTEQKLYSSLSGDKQNDKLVEQSLQRIMLLEAQLLEIMEETGELEDVSSPEEEAENKNIEEAVPETSEESEQDNLANAPEDSEQDNLANENEVGGL